VLPTREPVWTSTFIEVFARLDVEERAIRQALMRTAADGWLVSTRMGRRTAWSLTTDAEQLLSEGTQRIYSFDGTFGSWDERWLVVLARAPETERAARHVLRTRLGWAGLGSPAPGVWISPHCDRIEQVRRSLQEAGLLDGAQIFSSEHVGGASLTDLVRSAWDLDEIETHYEDFLDQFGKPKTHDPLRRVIELVHSWRRFPWIDPLLPRELLPKKWLGVAAAELFAKRHAQWSQVANEEWALLTSSEAEGVSARKRRRSASREYVAPGDPAESQALRDVAAP